MEGFLDCCGRLVGFSLKLMIFTIMLLVAIPQSSFAQQYASNQRTRAAIGYYSRSRAMMVQALEEFEQGRKLAGPDLLIDPEEWRLSVISLTEQLNRVIDPRPKVTGQGVVFRANPRMVRRERDRLPPVPDGARDSNVYGEQQRMQELQAARAKMYQPAEDAVIIAPDQQEIAEGEEESQEEEAISVEAEVEQPVAEDPSTVQAEASAEEEYLGTESALNPQQEEAEGLNDDEEMTAVIEQAVRDRLQTLEANVEDEEGEAEIELE